MRTMSGVSLIELVITVAIIGILLSLALPSFNTYIDNIRVRSAAENTLAGLQKARSEAVTRNVAIDFVLTNNPTLGAIDLTSTDAATGPLATGNNWVIQVNSPATLIEGKLGIEGTGRSASTAPATQVSGTIATSPATPAAFVTFTGFGGTTLAATATFQFSVPGNTCAAAGGPIRCLNVVVSRAGQVRLCDPAATAVGDTRGC